MTVIEIIILVVSGVILAMTGFMVFDSIMGMAKNDNTLKNRMIIIDAIYAYNHQQIREGEPDSLIDPIDVMEDYDETLKRQFDWGYTRIVPPDIFELIKPYIKENGEKET